MKSYRKTLEMIAILLNFGLNILIILSIRDILFLGISIRIKNLYYLFSRVIVPSRWVRLWLSFALLKDGDPPGPVNTSSLLVKDRNVPGGMRPKKSLKPPTTDSPGHYRSSKFCTRKVCTKKLYLNRLSLMSVYHKHICRRISLKAWQGLVSLYGVDGGTIAVVINRTILKITIHIYPTVLCVSSSNCSRRSK